MRCIYLSLLILPIFSLTVQAQPKKDAFSICRAAANVKNKLDTTASRGLVDNYFVWDNNKEITCRILAGSAALHQLIKKAATEWEQYANIKFRFSDEGFSHVRIMPGEGQGNNSQTGTQALMVPQDQPTLFIDTSGYKPGTPVPYLYATILHELGHVLGLLHELAHPASGIKWNKEAIYKYLQEQYPNDWAGENNAPRQAAYELFMEQFSTYYTNGFAYDNKSIMHYAIPARFTLDGYSTKPNLTLSQGDKQLVAALYPKGLRAEVHPRLIVTRLKSTYNYSESSKTAILDLDYQVDFAGPATQFYVAALLVDANNEYIEDDDDLFNIQGLKGVYDKRLLYAADSSGVLSIQSKISVPAEQLPKNKNNVTSVHLICYVRNEQTAELKRVYATIIPAANNK